MRQTGNVGALDLNKNAKANDILDETFDLVAHLEVGQSLGTLLSVEQGAFFGTLCTRLDAAWSGFERHLDLVVVHVGVHDGAGDDLTDGETGLPVTNKLVKQLTHLDTRIELAADGDKQTDIRDGFDKATYLLALGEVADRGDFRIGDFGGVRSSDARRASGDDSALAIRLERHDIALEGLAGAGQGDVSGEVVRQVGHVKRSTSSSAKSDDAVQVLVVFLNNATLYHIPLLDLA